MKGKCPYCNLEVELFWRDPVTESDTVILAAEHYRRIGSRSVKCTGSKQPMVQEKETAPP